MTEQWLVEEFDYDYITIGHRRRVDHFEGEGLSSGLSTSSMSHDRTGKPVVDRDKSHESGYEIQRQKTLNTNRSGFSWTDKMEQILLISWRRLENTNSRVIMTDTEIKWQKPAVDKIINFFLNSN